MPKVMGWYCPLTGDVYGPNDSRLAGYGNPPSSPGAQSQLKGAGAFPMMRQPIDMGELPDSEQARVPDAWIIPDEPTEEKDNA